MTIAAAPTSIALFAGTAPHGPSDRVCRLENFAGFERSYGGLSPGSHLGYAVLHFFENGGTQARVLRIESREDDATGTAPHDEDFQRQLLDAFAPGGLVDSGGAFNLLCVPGLTHAPTVVALQRTCHERRAFLLVDCAENDTVASVTARLADLAGPDAMNSALYFPWVRATDPLRQGGLRAFPPSGYVAGVMARIDARRGVWKAPAGVEAVIKGAAGASLVLNDVQQGLLNPLGINCLRDFHPHGTVLWGARTLHGGDSRGSEWKYIPVRRLALFLEESLYRGTDWVRFEPNGEPVWAKIRADVGDFMLSLWRQGAFQGRTPAEALLVRCDRSTMTQDDLDSGRVNIVVGFAPLKPAEFVILQIQQLAATIHGPGSAA
jgi:phage tail sheath protein FI